MHCLPIEEGLLMKVREVWKWPRWLEGHDNLPLGSGL